MRLVVRFFICSRLYCMGESTSVFIQRFVKLKCAYGDLCILTISRINYIYIFLFQFHSAISSDPYTRPLADPYFLKLTPAHALPKVMKIVVNWQDPCFNHLSEKARAVKKKCRVCQRETIFPSPLTNMLKTNGIGSGFWRWTQLEYHFVIGVESSMSQGWHFVLFATRGSNGKRQLQQHAAFGQHKQNLKVCKSFSLSLPPTPHSPPLSLMSVSLSLSPPPPPTPHLFH